MPSDHAASHADGARPNEVATARSRAYQLFQQALSYPEPELCEWIRSGVIAEELAACFDAIGVEIAADAADWSALCDAGEGDGLAIEYTRLFDAGASGPPCPLYGGLYGGARMKTMEEAIRFYNHFGLTLSEAQRELPDHLATQLEFIHFLSYREAEALEAGTDAGPYRRAQRDFVERHPGAWVPELCRRLDENEAHPFFRALFGRLGDLLVFDARQLRAQG